MNKLISLFAFIFMSTVEAGSLGFNIQFKADQISLQNTGTEAAYRLAVFSLGADQAWQALPVLSGDAHFFQAQKASQCKTNPA